MPQIVDRVTWMTPGAIEAKADAVLRGYQVSSGRSLALPIPVQQIIEGYLDLTLDWVPIPDDAGEPILACIYPVDRQIRMNQNHLGFFNQYFGTEAFTLAHEAGHWVLHVQISEFVQLKLLDSLAPKPYICRARRPGSSDSFEWQANQFASDLLMPEEMIRTYVSQASVYSWPALYAMKDVFAVTISALKIRLTGLNLLYVSDAGGVFPSQEAFSGQAKLA